MKKEIKIKKELEIKKAAYEKVAQACAANAAQAAAKAAADVLVKRSPGPTRCCIRSAMSLSRDIFEAS